MIKPAVTVVDMHSRIFNSSNGHDKACSDNGTDDVQDFSGVAPDRRRIHETYAAQYSLGVQSGANPMSYFALEESALSAPSLKPASAWDPAGADNGGLINPSSLKYTPSVSSFRASGLDAFSFPEKQQMPPKHVDNGPSKTETKGSRPPSNSFSPSSLEYNQERFSNLESPWPTRLPGITAAGPTGSGNVPTRPSSARLNGCQQPPAGTIGSSITERTSLMPSNNQGFFANGPLPGLNSNNTNQSTLQLEQAAADMSLFEPDTSTFYSTVSSTHSRNQRTVPSSRYNFLSDTAPNFQYAHLSNLSVPTSGGQLTPAPTPDSGMDNNVGVGNYPRSLGEQGRAYPVNTLPHRKLTRTPSTFVPATGQATSQLNAISNHNSANVGMSKQENFYSQTGFIEAAALTPRALPRLQVGTRSSATFINDRRQSSESFSPTSTLEDPFIDDYFNPRRKAQDVGLNRNMSDDEWISLSQYAQRKTQPTKPPGRSPVEKFERFDRWGSSAEYHSSYPQPRPVSPYRPTLSGIDHYHGSPQQPSKSRAVMLARTQLTQQSLYQHSSNTHRPQYESNSQRCGQSCYTNRLDLENTRRQLQEAQKQIGQLWKLLRESEQKCKVSEAQKQELLDRLASQNSSPTLICSAGASEVTPITATLLGQFYHEHSEAQYRRNSPGLARRDDDYFKSEFVMFFQDLKCWSDLYLKFPNVKAISPQLKESLEKVCETREYVTSLMNNERTKAPVVQGLISRAILEVLDPSFAENLQSPHDENEIEKFCDNFAKKTHNSVASLISRYPDPNAVEPSFKKFQGYVHHAARLSVSMAKDGGSRAWLIHFPKADEPFKGEWMEDAEYNHKKIPPTILERERALVKFVMTPLIVRIQQGKQLAVIHKAQCLLHSRI